MLVTFCFFTEISIVQCRSPLLQSSMSPSDKSSAVVHSFQRAQIQPFQLLSLLCPSYPWLPCWSLPRIFFDQEVLRSRFFTELSLGDLIDEVFCMSSISRGIYVSIMLGRLHSFRCHTKGGAMSKPCGDQVCVIWPQTGESLPYKHNRNLSNRFEALYHVARP